MQQGADKGTPFAVITTVSRSQLGSHSNCEGAPEFLTPPRWESRLLRYWRRFYSASGGGKKHPDVGHQRLERRLRPGRNCARGPFITGNTPVLGGRFHLSTLLNMSVVVGDNS